MLTPFQRCYTLLYPQEMNVIPSERRFLSRVEESFVLLYPRKTGEDTRSLHSAPLWSG
jgi:hypothetical protein